MRLGNEALNNCENMYNDKQAGACASSCTLQLNGTMNGEYWTMVCDGVQRDKEMAGGVGTNRTFGAQFAVFSSPSLFSNLPPFLSSLIFKYSIFGLYFFVVLAVGRGVRAFTVGMSQRVIYEDWPDADVIITQCRDIVAARFAALHVGKHAFPHDFTRAFAKYGVACDISHAHSLLDVPSSAGLEPELLDLLSVSDVRGCIIRLMKLSDIRAGWFEAHGAQPSRHDAQRVFESMKRDEEEQWLRLEADLYAELLELWRRPESVALVTSCAGKHPWHKQCTLQS